MAHYVPILSRTDPQMLLPHIFRNPKQKFADMDKWKHLIRTNFCIFKYIRCHICLRELWNFREFGFCSELEHFLHLFGYGVTFSRHLDRWFYQAFPWYTTKHLPSLVQTRYLTRYTYSHTSWVQKYRTNR